MDLTWLAFASASMMISAALIFANKLTATRRNDLRAVQAVHQRPTSRFGGLAIFLTFASGLVIGPTKENPIVFQTFVCVLPIFLIGICEDSGWHVAPRWRLMAACCSGLMTVFIYRSVINRLGFATLDHLLEPHAVAVALTVLVLMGVSQSFNLIDGLHGLCGGTAAVISLSLAAIAAKDGQTELVQTLTLLLAGIAGFLLLNFPRGLLFLGDAGATTIGFILAWMGIKILQLQPMLSPWALVLVFFWPIADMLLSIYRRLRRNHATTQPDRMHFHHVVMRSVEILRLRKMNRTISNPVATMILLPLIAVPSLSGVVLWNRSDLALMATFIYLALFLFGYRTLTLRAKHRAVRH